MSYTHRSAQALIGLLLLVIIAAAAIIISPGENGQGRAEASDIPSATQQFEIFGKGLPVSAESLAPKAQKWLEGIESPQSSRLAAEASIGAAGVDTAQVPDAAPIEGLATTESPSGSTIAVAASGNRICSFDEQLEIGVCASDALAQEGGAFSAAPAQCGTYKVTGLMPNGVSSLSVSTDSGRTESPIVVQSNVYEATLTAEKTNLVSTTGPPIEVELPLDQYEAMNAAC